MTDDIVNITLMLRWSLGSANQINSAAVNIGARRDGATWILVSRMPPSRISEDGAPERPLPTEQVESLLWLTRTLGLRVGEPIKNRDVIEALEWAATDAAPDTERGN